MIYADTSVVLAELLAEDQRPGDDCGTRRSCPAGCSSTKFGLASMRGRWRGATVRPSVRSWAASRSWSWFRPCWPVPSSRFPRLFARWTHCTSPASSSCANASRPSARHLWQPAGGCRAGDGDLLVRPL